MRALTVFLTFLISLTSYAEQESMISGTYSSLAYSEKSGDVRGKELKIVYSFEGYFGVLQCGSGVPTVIPLNVENNKISYELVEKNEKAWCGYGKTYEGFIENDGIKIWRKGKEASFDFLPRRESYWEERSRIL